METPEKRLKIDLELHVVGDGRTFLNYWNYRNGDDVVAEIIDGKLYLSEDVDKVEISLHDFVDQVKSKF